MNKSDRICGVGEETNKDTTTTICLVNKQTKVSYRMYNIGMIFGCFYSAMLCHGWWCDNSYIYCWSRYLLARAYMWRLVSLLIHSCHFHILSLFMLTTDDYYFLITFCFISGIFRHPCFLSIATHTVDIWSDNNEESINRECGEFRWSFRCQCS